MVGAKSEPTGHPERDATVKRPLPFVAGLVLTALGILFFLQGIGLVSGSTMSNTTTWSVLGPIIAVLGVALVYRGTRPPAPDRVRLPR
jgi:uncharacterized membrane protein